MNSNDLSKMLCQVKVLRIVFQLKQAQTTFYKSCARGFASSNCLVLTYDRNGSPYEVVRCEERQLKPPGHDEVKVKMLMAPVNPADINTIQGVYPIKPSFPAIGGFEGVGRVSEVGSAVTSLKAGDVVIPAINSLGTWRTDLVCKSDHVTVVPDGTPEVFAATLRVNMCTAYRMLKDFEELEPGDTVIQNAANSGAGQAVIQIAAARKLNTINIVRDRSNLDELKEYLHKLGGTVVATEAELRLNSSKLLQDVPTPRLALNAVGGKSMFTLIRNLRPHGTVVTYGGMSKQPVMIPTASLIFNNIKVKGYWMTRWHDNNHLSAEAGVMVEELCSWAREGLLQPPKHRFHKITECKAALELALTEQLTEKQIFMLAET